MLDAPEEIFYAATTHLKQLRRDISVACIQKLARKPYKQIDKQYLNMYEVFEKIKIESLAKFSATIKTIESNKLNGIGCESIDSAKIVDEDSSSNHNEKNVNSNNEDSTGLSGDDDKKNSSNFSEQLNGNNDVEKEDEINNTKKSSDTNDNKSSTKNTNNLVVVE